MYPGDRTEESELMDVNPPSYSIILYCRYIHHDQDTVQYAISKSASRGQPKTPIMWRDRFRL